MTDEIPAGFVSRSEAAEQCGVSSTAIGKWVDRGDVRGVKIRGQWHVHLEEALERGGRPLTDADTEEPEKSGVNVVPTIEIQGLLKQAQRHIETLHQPQREVLGILQEEISRLRKRCNELEDRHLAMLDVYEKTRSREHEQEMERARLTMDEQRKSEAFEQLMGFAPHVVHGLASKYLPGAAGQVQEGLLLQIVAGLSDEQLGAIQQTGALSGPVLSLMNDIRKKARESKTEQLTREMANTDQRAAS